MPNRLEKCQSACADWAVGDAMPLARRHGHGRGIDVVVETRDLEQRYCMPVKFA